MTILRFSGGETLRVGLDLARVQELLQTALAENILLELEGPSGEVIVVNPQQVQFLRAVDEAATSSYLRDDAQVPAGA
jgi:hypothetical protein